MCDPNKRIRVGLLGGSFNPAHDGHRHISLYALKALGLHEIWWLVSPQNPLKPKSELAPYEQRLSFAQEVAAHPRIRVTDIERKLGTRYTIDTLRALMRRYPQIEFVWLMGADNLASLHRWHRFRAIFSLVPIVVFDRSPFSHTALRKKAAQCFAHARRAKIRPISGAKPPVWEFIYMARHPESASNLRKTLGKNAFLRHTEHSTISGTKEGE